MKTTSSRVGLVGLTMLVASTAGHAGAAAPVCGDVRDCLVQSLDVGEQLCDGDPIHPKLLRVLGKKFGKALTLIDKIGATQKYKRATKLRKKSEKQVSKVGRKAEKFAARGKDPISPACNGVFQSVVGAIQGHFLSGALGVPFPPPPGGTGGSCTMGRWMSADVGGQTFTPRSDDAVFHVPGFTVIVQGCRSLDPGDPVGCEQMLILSFPLNVQATSPGVVSTFDCGDPSGFTYIEFYEEGQDGYFATGCTISVEGTPGICGGNGTCANGPAGQSCVSDEDCSHLHGTFSGTLSNFIDPEPLEVTNGCFSSWPFS